MAAPGITVLDIPLQHQKDVTVTQTLVYHQPWQDEVGKAMQHLAVAN